MNKIYLIRTSIAAVLLFFALSCSESFLEQKNPNAVVPNTYWSNETEAIAGINGIYSPLSDITLFGRINVFASDYRSDVLNNYWHGVDTRAAQFQGDPESDGVTFWTYRQMWEVIARANLAIEKLPDVQGVDQERIDEWIGEVHFLRAFGYFMLIRNFLHMPLSVSTTDAYEYDNFPQVQPWVLWNHIVADLLVAKEKAPSSWPITGRATSAAATALLGKVYLYRATLYKAHEEFAGGDVTPDPAVDASREYANAKAQFQELINSNNHDLTVNYTDNFTNVNENNVESLFEIQLQEDFNNLEGWGIAVNQSRSNSFGKDLVNTSYGRLTTAVHDWALDLFLAERTNDDNVDPRAFATLFWNSDDSTEHAGFMFKNVTNRADTDPLQPLRTYEECGFAFDTLIWCKKYTGVYEFDAEGNRIDMGSFNSNHSANLRLIRFADVLLMYAEADLLDDGTISADGIAAFNRVRARVNMPDKTAITMQDIEDERVRELTLERCRYYDLLRWGKVEEKLTVPGMKSNGGGTGAYREGREYLPIPLNDISQYDGWVQNPGYE